MKKQHNEVVQGTEKEFLDVFKQLCYSRSAWQVWEDVIMIIALSIANATEWNKEKKEQREKIYCDCVKKIGGEKMVQLVSKLMAIIIMALEENPEQDFLGKIYMELELYSHWKGQFFTPYSVCKFMATMNVGEGTKNEIKEKGYFSVCDPACGAGALLIAYANELKKKEINYQQTTVFVGQDIDVIVGMMCYIQLSLLGCAGYIVIADTLTNPICGDVLNPIEKEGQQFWYMPMFQMEQWHMKRWLHKIKKIGKRIEKTIPEKPVDVVTQREKKQLEDKKKKNEVIAGQLDLFSMLK